MWSSPNQWTATYVRGFVIFTGSFEIITSGLSSTWECPWEHLTSYWVTDFRSRQQLQTTHFTCCETDCYNKVRFYRYFSYSKSSDGHPKPHFQWVLGMMIMHFCLLQVFSNRKVVSFFGFCLSNGGKKVNCTLSSIWNCQIIQEGMVQQLMPVPTEARVEKFISDFYKRCNFPNCLGCFDEKHYRVNCPPKSGSTTSIAINSTRWCCKA